MSRSEKSAEAVVAADAGRRAEREGMHEAVPVSRAMRQMPPPAGRVDTIAQWTTRTGQSQTGTAMRSSTRMGDAFDESLMRSCSEGTTAIPAIAGAAFEYSRAGVRIVARLLGGVVMRRPQSGYHHAFRARTRRRP